MRFALVLLFYLAAHHAVAGEWFQHKFGEMRAYHGSWLAVCEEQGRGNCRAVQLAGDDASDGARRLAVYVRETGFYTVSVFQRGWTLAEDHSVTVTLDGKITALLHADWKRGELAIPNVAETITIVSDDVNARLVAGFKARNSAVFTMGTETERIKAVFDLAGMTAALNAIETHMTRRGS